MIFAVSPATIGHLMAHVNAKWVLSWPKLGSRWFKLARSRTKLVPNTIKLWPSWVGMTISGESKGAKQALGPSQRVQGCTKEAPRRHQGGTREAPRRHQGGTEEAPSRQLHIVMGPRAPPCQRGEL